MNDKYKMEIKTGFYDSFTCIADRCPITCCREWKIAVDKNTEMEWKHLCMAGEHRNLASYVITKDKQRVIGLKKQVCPFLNKEGLCKLVLEFGQDVLSMTCDTFPRQHHDFENRTEYALVSCCPWVIDLLHQNKRNVFEQFIQYKQDPCTYARSVFLELLGKESIPINIALMTGFNILLSYMHAPVKDLHTMQAICKKESIQECIEVIGSLETHAKDSLVECNELFLDLMDNYRREGLYEEFLTRLCSKAEEWEELLQENKVGDWQDYGKQIRQYDNLLRKWLMNECCANLILEDMDEEELTVLYQWMVMEYSAVLHAMKLQSSINAGIVSYEEIREILVIISRITGYDEEDITAYMENSFQNKIWEFGYMHLLLNK